MSSFIGVLLCLGLARLANLDFGAHGSDVYGHHCSNDKANKNLYLEKLDYFQNYPIVCDPEVHRIFRAGPTVGLGLNWLAAQIIPNSLTKPLFRSVPEEFLTQYMELLNCQSSNGVNNVDAVVHQDGSIKPAGNVSLIYPDEGEDWTVDVMYMFAKDDEVILQTPRLTCFDLGPDATPDQVTTLSCLPADCQSKVASCADMTQDQCEQLKTDRDKVIKANKE